VACVGGGTFPCHGPRNELNAKWRYSYTYDKQKLRISRQYGEILEEDIHCITFLPATGL
jgi:hypothetical protein